MHVYVGEFFLKFDVELLHLDRSSSSRQCRRFYKRLRGEPPTSRLARLRWFLAFFCHIFGGLTEQTRSAILTSINTPKYPQHKSQITDRHALTNQLAIAAIVAFQTL